MTIMESNHTYTFINPNSRKVFAQCLERILIDKLLSVCTATSPAVR